MSRNASSQENTLVAFVRQYIFSLRALGMHVIKNFGKALVFIRRKLSPWEFLFLLCVAVLFFLLSLGWRVYQIAFSETFAVKESIITDDFFWLFLLLLLPPLPTIFMLAAKEKAKLRLASWLLRMGSLLLISLLYVSNLLWPQRIASTPAAHFSVAFWLFAVFLVTAILSGFFSLRDFFEKTIFVGSFSPVSPAVSSDVSFANLADAATEQTQFLKQEPITQTRKAGDKSNIDAVDEDNISKITLIRTTNKNTKAKKPAARTPANTKQKAVAVSASKQDKTSVPKTRRKKTIINEVSTVAAKRQTAKKKPSLTAAPKNKPLTTASLKNKTESKARTTSKTRTQAKSGTNKVVSADIKKGNETK